MTAEILTQ